MLKSLFLVVAILVSLPLFSRADTKFQSESEAGAVIVSGNSSSESYSAKTKNIYTQDKNIYTLEGRYLRTTAGGVESARSWEAGIRYERALNDYFGLFVGHKAESDVYAGYIQRDSEDLGGKYNLIKSELKNWSAELGYRYSVTYQVDGTKSRDSFGRIYSEYSQTLQQNLTLKYWIEYLPNFTESRAYLLNTEASLSVMLNKVFSLKIAYLLQYQNMPPNDGKHVDTTYTTSLVAKF